MGSKKSCFTYVKRLFVSKPKPKSKEIIQKSKNWRWFNFKHYPAIKPSQITSLNDAAVEQCKHAVTVAIATTTVAEAATDAVAEVIRPTNTPYQFDQKIVNLAAIRIQTTYRGYLGRKALKGVVKLQAVIRGELVRRSIVKKLASIYLFEKLQPLVHRHRVPTLLDYLKPQELNLRSDTRKSWDLSFVSEEAIYLKKQEAITKKELTKQYSVSHRERRNNKSLQESLSLKEIRSCRFDQYAEISDTNKLEKLKLRSLTRKQGKIEESSSPFSQPRRLFCRQKSKGDYGSFPDSPAFPAYMAATESAKAKFRSLSTPKQRLRFCDAFSGQNSPYSWSSYHGEMTNERNSLSSFRQ